MDPAFEKIPGQKFELILSPQGTLTHSENEIPKIPFDYKDIHSIHSELAGTLVGKAQHSIIMLLTSIQ